MYLNQEFKNSFRILKGGKISLVVSGLLISTTISIAAPSEGIVTSGIANITQSGNTTNINQSSNKASINWNKFDIKNNETVNFNQPNSSSITLNRVIGNEKSVIDGALNANGQVWILNSNGILFNKNAKINTAGLIATTAELSDTNFQNGNYDFKNNSSESVINLGLIEVSNNGSVVLAANEVVNSGTIKAVRGKVHLVGADEYTVNLNGNSLVNLIVTKGVLDAMVENSGSISASGGEIYLTTNAVNELLKGVVNNTGIIEANSLDGLMGKVEMFAHGGEVQVGGTITAIDGFVETSGKDFTILENSTIKAGEWLIDPVDITIDATLAGTIETALGSGDVTIKTDATIKTDSPTITSTVTVPTSNQTSTDGDTTDGDIYVNSAITWSSTNKLTLDAADSIYINADITATAGQLALYYGDSGDYNVNAKVNLSAGDNFFTKQTSDGAETTWKVITELGDVGSATGTDLQGINGNLSGNYVLGGDIDAVAATIWNHDGNSGYNGFDPLGDDTTQFTGKFDGLGHTISKLKINRATEDFVGLFGVTNVATIQNIGLVDVQVFGKDNVGSLVGWNYTDSKVINSYSTGTGIVNGTTNVGGLVGNNNAATITNSYSTATVNGPTNIGGLVGINEPTSNTKITNSYSTGIVNGTTNVGGLVGYNRKEITNSYATGIVNGTTNVGGLTGKNDAAFVITNSFYDSETNTDASMGDSATYGKTKAQITELLTNNIWDTNIWSYHQAAGTGVSVAGYEYAKAGLPYLTNITRTTDIDTSESISLTLFNSGYGTDINPYTITNWTQLQNINNSNILTKGYYFDLSNSIDSSTSDYTDLASGTANSGAGWNPLGDSNSNAFIGTFDGLGNTISDLYINRPITDYIGLLGYADGSNIKNIGLVNVDITGKYYVGALLGVSPASGSITNSYASGKVKGNDYVGGLIGQRGNTQATITNSYASVTVTGTGTAIGGLIGSNQDVTITNSFYDSTKNPTSVTEAGVTGKTTEELSYGKTFKDASWDIVADSSVTSLTPVLKYNSTTSLYYWAIAPLEVTYTLSDESKTYDGVTQNLNDLYTNVITTNADLVGSAYKFQVNNIDVTGYKDAGTYENIKVALDGTNDFLAIASSGNTDGKYVIKQKTVTPTPTPTPTPPVVEPEPEPEVPVVVEPEPEVPVVVEPEIPSGPTAEELAQIEAERLAALAEAEKQAELAKIEAEKQAEIEKQAIIEAKRQETLAIQKVLIQKAQSNVSSIVKGAENPPRIPQMNSLKVDENNPDEENPKSNINERRVALYKGSIIGLLNGGINLPSGLKETDEDDSKESEKN